MLAFQQVYVNLVMTEVMNEGNRWFGNFDIIWALDYICDAILDNVDASSSLVNCLVFHYEVEIQAFVRKEITFLN